MFAASKGVKNAEPDICNPFALLLYKQQAKEKVDPDAARTFLELADENRLPSWVAIAADIKLIQAAAG